MEVKEYGLQPTKAEIKAIIKKTEKKMESFKINKTELARLLEINRATLTQVLNGKLVNINAINKLNKWINE